MRIKELFQKKDSRILNIYFTAGYPKLNDTRALLRAIQEAGADLVEIGIPFSDPVADGETIQMSNTKALENGMNLQLLFEQLKGVREEIHIPMVFMGDVNPILQFGVEAFCEKCAEIGIDGLIIPNLPLSEYKKDFESLFKQYGLTKIFLVTPQTSDERIREIDKASNGFVYVVSSSSTTGSTAGITEEMLAYFKRLQDMRLSNPRLIGFGIKNAETFTAACGYAQGAIIGSAFIRELESENPVEAAKSFIKGVLK